MPHLSWRRIASWLLALGVGLALIAATLVLSGAYNVAASVEHLRVTEVLLRVALHRSVAVRGDNEPPPDFDSPQLAWLGARHYRTGCEPCHGAPGVPINPVTEAMYPSPPGLARAAREWSDAELAWIVEHGLKFTGMPAWPAAGRTDEVWPVVAFIRALPELDADGYSRMLGPLSATALPTEVADVGGSVPFCEACHGTEDAPPLDPRVPSLNGQKAQYLQRALFEYRDGIRRSGMMEPIAAALGDRQIEALAAHFSGNQLLPGETQPRADSIVSKGIPARLVPPCLSCHGAETSGQFPRLEGLSPHYLRTQLRLFRSGIRGETAYGKVMAAIAARLSEEDITAASAHFGGAAETGDGQGERRRQ